MEREETIEETNAQASTEECQTEESQTKDVESEDSLPELISEEADTMGDSGYVFLNTPPSTEEEDTETEERHRREEKERLHKAIDKADEEAQMQESTINLY